MLKQEVAIIKKHGISKKLYEILSKSILLLKKPLEFAYKTLIENDRRYPRNITKRGSKKPRNRLKIIRKILYLMASIKQKSRFLDSYSYDKKVISDTKLLEKAPKIAPHIKNVAKIKKIDDDKSKTGIRLNFKKITLLD